MRCLNLSLVIALVCASAGISPDCAADPPLDVKLVTVTGSAEVTAMPDRARLTMSVDNLRPDVKSARAESNRVMRDYLAKAKALGARDEDVQSTGFSIRPEYDNSPANPATLRLTGYHVTHTIVVQVRDLERLGDFLQTATDCGINNVSDPELESSRIEMLNRDALARAAQDAQAKAQILASALGARLGPVHTVDASAGFSTPPGRVFAAAGRIAQNGNAEMGVNVGEIRISATLTAAFDLLPP